MRGDLRASRQARQSPWLAATNASGQAARRGIPDCRTANGASAAISSSAPTSHRDGDHSSGKLADPLDQGVEFGIGGGLVAHHPMPEFVVFGVQQP